MIFTIKYRLFLYTLFGEIHDFVSEITPVKYQIGIFTAVTVMIFRIIFRPKIF